MAQGVGKGKTNNPFGRPKGAKDKVSAEIKAKLSKFLEGNFKEFEKDFKAEERTDIRMRIYLEAMKLIIPKPRDEEEDENALNKRDELIVRLFNLDKEKD